MLPVAMAKQGAQEVEWQFDAVDIRPVERWLVQSPAKPASMSVTPAGVQTIVDTYTDTDDWRLYRAGYSLRIRRTVRRFEATLKGLDAAVDGLRRRQEISQPVASADLSGLPAEGGPVGDRVRVMIGNSHLELLFQVRTRRKIFQLDAGGAPAAEIVLDQTTIPVADGQEPARLRRVEVEARGDAADLATFARQMREACGLQPASLSKFEAALLAKGLDPQAAFHYGSTEVGPDSSLGEVAFAVLRRDFHRLLAHEPGTRLGEDPEELHDMRVASRRLRAALGLFRPALPVAATRLRDELGWLGELLGAVRDLDVQWAQSQALASAGDPLGPDAVAALAALLLSRREEARRVLVQALDSRRYERLTRSFAGFLRRGPVRRSVIARAPARALVPDLLETLYGKVRKARRRIGGTGSPAAYHKLRIRCKRLRYGLEFVSAVYDGPVPPLVRRLVKVQDILGLHQDAQVAMARLREWVGTDDIGFPPLTVFALGGLAERYAQQADGLRKAFPKVYRKLSGPWRDLKKVLERDRPPGWRPAANVMSEGGPWTSTSSDTPSPPSATARGGQTTASGP